MPYVRRNYQRKKYAGGNRRTGGRNFTRPRAKKVPYKYKTAIKRTVASIVAKGRENKYAAFAARPTTIPAVIGKNQVVNVMRVLPPISQGVGEYSNRVGNKITPKYMEIRGWCTLDMTDSDKDYDRVAVRIFVGFPKQFPLHQDSKTAIQNQPLDNWSYRLIDSGTGPGAFNGDLTSYQSPLNSDVWTSKAERRFTLMRPRIWDAPLTGDDFARSTAGSYKFFKMRIKCPPTLCYAQNADNLPKNFDPTLLAGYSLLNGSAPGDPTTAPKQVTISYTTRLSYEDA